MKFDNYEYVILNKNKEPTHKFKNGGKPWNEVKDFDNVAVLVKAPYMILDFDTVTDAFKAMEIIQSKKLKCSVMKTTRGYHVWFRTLGTYTNTVKAKLACGIRADIKCYGKPNYVIIKQNGLMREWLQEYEEKELDYLPPYFMPVSDKGDYPFLGMGKGDGRNQKLFSYIEYLQKHELTKEQILVVTEVINKYIFKEPLSEREYRTVTRNEAFKEGEELKKLQETAQGKKGFDHEAIANKIRESCHIKTVDQTVYIYSDNDGFYKKNTVKLDNMMRKIMPNITIRQRAEVMSDIKDGTTLEREDIKVFPYIINCKNCRLNLITGERLDHTPDVYEFGKLPVVYDPDAHCEDVDNFLKDVFSDDVECIQLFYEMVADILTKENIYQKAFLFVGNGANGKSKMLDMLRAFVGPQYCSNISLEDLNSKFKTAELENKLLNIGADIDSVTIKNSGVLKKIFSGDPMTVERKFAKPFDIVPYATHIFSCNSIPPNADRSSGMYRRWMIIPFDVNFLESPKNDPHIVKKITTPTALSYLLNLALIGFKSLHERKHFIEPARVKAKKEDYIVENSSALSWAREMDMDQVKLGEKPRDLLYDDYRSWCATTNVKPMAAKTFYKEIRFKYRMIIKQKKSDGKRYFMLNLNEAF